MRDRVLFITKKDSDGRARLHIERYFHIILLTAVESYLSAKLNHLLSVW